MKTKIGILSGFLVFCSVILYSQGMIIQQGASVNVTGGVKLIIDGATKGKLTIKSTSAGTGSLVVDNNARSSVNVPSNNSYVERYLVPEQWHYISSPISNGLSEIFTGDYLRASDQTTSNGWGPYIISTTDPLAVMGGYSVWKPTANANWKEVFNGDLNNGDLFINVGVSGSGPWAGWSLVGNPYPCPINLLRGLTWKDVDPTVWFWNGAKGNYECTTFPPGDDPRTGGTHSGIVPAMQGFFVHATSETASVAITNASRIHSTETFLKSSPNPHLVIRAEWTGNFYSDMISVDFNPDATANYDPGYDAYKLTGLNEAPQLWTKINDTSVTCNSLPFSQSEMTVPMGFSSGLSGDYTLTAGNLETFDPATSVSLEDLLLNISRDLKIDPVYNFTYDTQDGRERFLLHFNNPSMGSPQEQSLAQPLQVYSCNNIIYVRNTGVNPMNGKMSVYDPLGRELFTSGLIDAPVSKYEVNLSTGYYVVMAMTTESTCSKKVFITR
ncbi:MAG: hypothetical protein NTW10_05830 [Bacteroidetes bacterium]|nr:hypothetical protein [Bacteroidota bacterium]